MISEGGEYIEYNNPTGFCSFCQSVLLTASRLSPSVSPAKRCSYNNSENAPAVATGISDSVATTPRAPRLRKVGAKPETFSGSRLPDSQVFMTINGLPLIA